MPDIRYISSFLARVEGPSQTQGYIPCFRKAGGTANYKGNGNPNDYIAMGASGVTIACGCDLGQTDQATLKSYGLADQHISHYLPYLGKRKQDAIAMLHLKPLTVSVACADATDLAVHGGYLKRFVIPAYESASGLSFREQPKQAQAVIMSVCFQKGTGGVRRDWPKLWNHLVNARWPEAAQELLTGFKQYQGRRKTEGRLLLELCQ